MGGGGEGGGYCLNREYREQPVNPSATPSSVALFYPIRKKKILGSSLQATRLLDFGGKR